PLAFLTPFHGVAPLPVGARGLPPRSLLFLTLSYQEAPCPQSIRIIARLLPARTSSKTHVASPATFARCTTPFAATTSSGRSTTRTPTPSSRRRPASATSWAVGCSH